MYRRTHRRTVSAVALSISALIMVGSNVLTGSSIRVSPYLTRAEAAAILMLSSTTPLPKTPYDNPYTDILPTDWFAPSILAAAKIGVLSPDETGTKLRPFGSVNRATFMKMLTLTFGLPVYQQHAFTDVPSTSWYAPYVGFEETYRLFSHSNPTKFEPNRLLTQDEARTAMRVFLQQYSKVEEEAARKTATAQASGHVQLYTVISTKKLRVLLTDDARQRTVGTATSSRSPTLSLDGASRTSSATARGVSTSSAKPSSIDDVRAEILSLVNAARTKAKLQPLIRNEYLERSAQAYADQMNNENFFGHTDPNGKTLTDRIDASRYASPSVAPDCNCIKSYALGENLARGQRTAAEVVKAWMDSPSHKAAILEPDFTDLGIGVQSGVWVQHFGGVVVTGR